MSPGDGLLDSDGPVDVAGLDDEVVEPGFVAYGGDPLARPGSVDQFSEGTPADRAVNGEEETPFTV